MKSGSFKKIRTEKAGYKKIEVDGWILENEKDLPLNKITEKYTFGVCKTEKEKRYFVVEIGSSIALTKGFLTRKEAINEANEIMNSLTIERFDELVISSNEYLEKLELLNK